MTDELFNPQPFEQIRGQTALDTDAREREQLDRDLHPDLVARCRRCHRPAYEHDSFDMACPDDDDHARINRAESML